MIDTSKLPKWAQAYIQNLEYDVTYWKSLAERSYSDDETTAYLRAQLAFIPLPHDADIYFGKPHDYANNIAVRQQESGPVKLRIVSSQRLIVLPHADNVVSVKVGEY